MWNYSKQIVSKFAAEHQSDAMSEVDESTQWCFAKLSAAATLQFVLILQMGSCAARGVHRGASWDKVLFATELSSNWTQSGLDKNILDNILENIVEIMCSSQLGFPQIGPRAAWKYSWEFFWEYCWEYSWDKVLLTAQLSSNWTQSSLDKNILVSTKRRLHWRNGNWYHPPSTFGESPPLKGC